MRHTGVRVAGEYNRRSYLAFEKGVVVMRITLAAALVCSAAFSQSAFAFDVGQKEGGVGAPLDAGGQIQVAPDSGGTPVAEAGTSLVCGKVIYHISTSTSATPGANCHGTGTDRVCEDTQGNSAKASCKGGCGNTTGDGQCTATLK